MFGNIVSLTVTPGRRDQFLAAAEANARSSRDLEPGCLRFDLLEDPDDPNHFYFYEIFVNEAAFDEHFTTDHFHAWSAAVESGMLESRTVMRCNTLVPGDEEWR